MSRTLVVVVALAAFMVASACSGGGPKLPTTPSPPAPPPVVNPPAPPTEPPPPPPSTTATVAQEKATPDCGSEVDGEVYFSLKYALSGPVRPPAGTAVGVWSSFSIDGFEPVAGSRNGASGFSNLVGKVDTHLWLGNLKEVGWVIHRVGLVGDFGVPKEVWGEQILPCAFSAKAPVAK